MKFHIQGCVRTIVAAAALLGAAGCGKPAMPQGGPPPDMQVLSVVAPVVVRPVGDVLDLVGELTPRDAVELLGETDARLVELGFEEGDAVVKGQLLFRFDAARPQAQLAQAHAAHALAEASWRRAVELRASNTIPQQELDQAEAALRGAEAALALARAHLADTRLEAPFDGTIARRTVSVGQFVHRGQRLASLVRTGPLELVFHVPERAIAWLARGQSVEFHAVADAAPVSADIVYLAPQLDAVTRTLEVKARLAESARGLRPGMFGRVRLTVNVAPAACVIPAPALIFAAQGVRVVVRNAEGRAEFRAVVPGRRMDGLVEIAQGLAVGEQVVVEGHQKIGPGMGILISPKSVAYGIAPAAGGAASSPTSEAPRP